MNEGKKCVFFNFLNHLSAIVCDFLKEILLCCLVGNNFLFILPSSFMKTFDLKLKEAFFCSAFIKGFLIILKRLSLGKVCAYSIVMKCHAQIENIKNKDGISLNLF